jgi:hypothetical protein
MFFCVSHSSHATTQLTRHKNNRIEYQQDEQNHYDNVTLTRILITIVAKLTSDE